MKKIIFEQTGNIITTPLIAFAMIQSIFLSPQSINKYKHHKYKHFYYCNVNKYADSCVFNILNRLDYLWTNDIIHRMKHNYFKIEKASFSYGEAIFLM